MNEHDNGDIGAPEQANTAAPYQEDEERMSSEEIKEIVRHAVPYFNEHAGRYDETHLGTPRIIIQLRTCRASIVFVSRTKQWKIFWPFPNSTQTKQYCPTLHRMVQFVYELARTV